MALALFRALAVLEQPALEFLFTKREPLTRSTRRREMTPSALLHRDL